MVEHSTHDADFLELTADTPQGCRGPPGSATRLRRVGRSLRQRKTVDQSADGMLLTHAQPPFQ